MERIAIRDRLNMAVATQYYADHEEGRISIENLNMVYETDKGDKVTALTDVNLEIESGSFVSLLGPSGCGKTTLLRIIADLITPTSGAVSVGGMSPTEARMARKLGMVFQSAVLYDWRSVLKNVEMPLEIMHLPKGERRDRAEHMLEMVGLKDFAHRYPYELSGGMQQRVSIARALAVNPRILLMDEPFSALDEFTREKLHDDLLGIRPLKTARRAQTCSSIPSSRLTLPSENCLFHALKASPFISFQRERAARRSFCCGARFHI